MKESGTIVKVIIVFYVLTTLKSVSKLDEVKMFFLFIFDFSIDFIFHVPFLFFFLEKKEATMPSWLTP